MASTSSKASPFYFVGSTPSIPSHLIKKRNLHIEPKVPFANERTFLAWMQWATFLAGASAAFASFSDVKHDPLTQIIGLLIIPFAIGIIIHALDQFLKRSEMIKLGDNTDNFVDKQGPVILSTILMISLVSTFIIKILKY
mmetsp:Transcript_13791/g.19766  ORF Transcript_13791/g.19766 Transcript_13791/m.19766 type:complete len:140 (+) Transcript_13791:106-525(+)